VLNQPLAFELFVAISQIFEYYMYHVNVFFGSAPPAVSVDELQQTMSAKLRKTLARFREKFAPPATSAILGGPGDNAPKLGSSGTSANVTDEVLKIKWVPAKPNPAIASDLNNIKLHYGLNQRTVAVESLLFVAEALAAAKPILLALLPPTATDLLTNFYNDEVGVSGELRTHIYKTITSAFLSTEATVNAIANARWEMTTVPVMSSAYVDQLLKEFTQFGQRLDRAVVLPPKVRGAVWDAAIMRAMEQLVEGYSRIKKCTNEGRAILLQDLKAIQTGIEKMLNTPPKNSTILYAENYIKAYYLPLDNDIVDFSKDHPEYSLRHVVALVNVNPAAAQNRTKRAQVIGMLEDLDRARRATRV